MSAVLAVPGLAATWTLLHLMTALQTATLALRDDSFPPPRRPLAQPLHPSAPVRKGLVSRSLRTVVDGPWPV